MSAPDRMMPHERPLLSSSDTHCGAECVRGSAGAHLGKHNERTKDEVDDQFLVALRRKLLLDQPSDGLRDQHVETHRRGTQKVEG